MVIEWKRIELRPDLRRRYLEKDAEVWTAGLAAEAGFLGKEVWLDEEDPGAIALVIRWASEEAWRAVPRERLGELDRRFRQELPEGWREVESRVWRVWRR